MLHLRIIAAADMAAAVCATLDPDPAVTSLAVVPGAARKPSGDLVFCDVVREGAGPGRA